MGKIAGKAHAIPEKRNELHHVETWREVALQKKSDQRRLSSLLNEMKSHT